MSLNLRHPVTNVVKEIPEGFSWTTFFFSLFVPISRGMWGPALLILITSGLASLYYMFTINKLYAQELLEKGYTPASSIDSEKLKAHGLLA